jgi:hypothetical protein
MRARAITEGEIGLLRTRLVQLLWFVGLWIAGVLALGAVAWLIRWALAVA